MTFSWGPILIALIMTLTTIVVSMGILLWVVIRLPEDYFYRHSLPDGSLPNRSSPNTSTQPLCASQPPSTSQQPQPGKTLWQTLRLIAQWGLGIVLIVAGLFMLFLPGQGLLTIILGLMLVQFPGKQKLMAYVLKKLGSDVSLKKINRLRAFFKRPAMQPPHE